MMILLVSILIAVIALLHLSFVYLEMVAWETMGPKIFGYPREFFTKTKRLAANQGLYNGFLLAGLLWTFFITDMLWWGRISTFFLSCVFVAGVFGGVTVSKKIFVIQALPALLALILLQLQLYVVS